MVLCQKGKILISNADEVKDATDRFVTNMQKLQCKIIYSSYVETISDVKGNNLNVIRLLWSIKLKRIRKYVGKERKIWQIWENFQIILLFFEHKFRNSSSRYLDAWMKCIRTHTSVCIYIILQNMNFQMLRHDLRTNLRNLRYYIYGVWF